MIELSVIRDLVAIASFLIALSYYIINIKNQNKTRRAQLFMNLYDTYRSPEFRKIWHTQLHLEFKDYEEWKEKYVDDMDALAGHTSVMSFFEGVGVLLKRNLIDIEIIDDLLSVAIRGYWRKYEPVVVGSRNQINEPKMMADTEYLYNELMKINKEAPDFNKLWNR